MGDKINGSGIKVTYIKELTAVLFENYVLFTENGMRKFKLLQNVSTKLILLTWASYELWHCIFVLWATNELESKSLIILEAICFW